MKKKSTLLATCLLGVALLATSCKQASMMADNSDSLTQCYIADTAIFAQEDTIGAYFTGEYPLQQLQMDPAWGNDSTMLNLVSFYNYSATAHILTNFIDDYTRFMEYQIGGVLLDNVNALSTDFVGTQEVNRFNTRLIDSFRQLFTIAQERESKLDTDQVDTGFFNDPRFDRIWGPTQEFFDSVVTATQVIVPDSLDFVLFYSSRPFDALPEKYIGIWRMGEDAVSYDADQLVKDITTNSDRDVRIAELFAMMGSHQDGYMQFKISECQKYLESGIYSPSLIWLWKAYRYDYNDLNIGMSSFNYSPNIRYNHFRRIVAHTILRHIWEHPEDRAAKVEFFFLCIDDDILRFGDFMFGNQAPAEYFQLYSNLDE